MASSEKFALTPRFTVGSLSPKSGSARVLATPLSDDALWKRLKEAGFDEESIKRRDKSALIGYIAKLEAELYDHQHQMGLLILEKKDWLSKYEEAKSAADVAEANYKRERASHMSDLADARKREDSLKKALGIEKECVHNIEKTLHEMRAEYAEVKVAAESKFTEARKMVDDALKKFSDAEDKLRAAQSLEAEASRYHRMAERKLHETEEREDDLRRRMAASKSDLEAKEKQIQLERETLSERHKSWQKMHEKLLDSQALLNQRKEYMLGESQELKKFEKDLAELKASLDNERSAINAEKQVLALKESSLSSREEAVLKKECDLRKKEEANILLQAKLASKESDNVQQIIANQESTLAIANSALQAQLELQRRQVEDEANAKRRVWELKELDIKQREDFISEREHELDVQSRRLQDSLKELEERLTLIEEKEKNLSTAEEEFELKKCSIRKEKEELEKMKLGLSSLQANKKDINDAEEKAEAISSESTELLALEVKLKEEIDIISAQKRELEADSERLQAEKAKFEAEWELIDEKREELAKDAQHVSEERLAISKLLKDERESLKAEKDMLRNQYKQDHESLAREREVFMSELEHQRAEWFSKIQKERADHLLDIEVQRKELENRIDKRREEIESQLAERDRQFEEKKTKELQHIASLKESVGKELEHVNSEVKRLESERREINLDREKRDKEWAELNNSIEELKVQREKLEKQRELLRSDREEILAHIESLKRLEDLHDKLDSITTNEMHQSRLQANNEKISSKRLINQHEEKISEKIGTIDDGLGHEVSRARDSDRATSPLSAPFSWIKRCADTLLDQRLSNKRRRQGHDMETSGLGNITPIFLEKKSIVGNNDNEMMGLNQPPAGRQASVYVDKITEIREVTTVEVEIAVADSKNDEKVEKNGVMEL